MTQHDKVLNSASATTTDGAYGYEGVPRRSEEAPKSLSSWARIGLGIGALAAVAGVAMATSGRRGLMRRTDSDDGFTLQLQTDESMRMISSKKVEGTTVYGRDGERLGEIGSFMVDKYSGRVGYAVMTCGGTMGFGESLFPLPWSALTYEEEQGGYRLPITSDQLANAPRFEKSEEPEFSPEYRRQVLLFYCTKPATAVPAKRRYDDAVDAGYARRGFLRGVQAMRSCPPQ